MGKQRSVSNFFFRKTGRILRHLYSHDRSARLTSDVKEKLEDCLDDYEGLDQLIRAIRWTIQRDPEAEGTRPLGDEYPNHRIFSRAPRPELDLPIPKVTVLYEYDEDEVIFYAVRIDDGGQTS